MLFAVLPAASLYFLYCFTAKCSGSLLMQMHSSYVVTDPKGTVLVECGKMLLKNNYRVKVLNTINFKKSMHLKYTIRRSAMPQPIPISKSFG